jgi:Asp-tRNA(Asn)/Glu-tRNA(Gln) amidotransferase A subunit family amidase
LNTQAISALAAVELADNIRRTTLPPTEAAAAVLARIHELNPKINAYRTLAGQPAAPCGCAANGLPVGLQIAGRRFDDAPVRHASAAFEAARPWRQH